MPAFEFVSKYGYGVFVKKCTKCGREYLGTKVQAESESIFAHNFSRTRITADGFLGHCKKCQHDMMRRSRGLTGTWGTDEMLKAQDGKCAICAKHIEFKQGPGNGAQLDHNQETGEVRGLLCIKCNRGLGQFQEAIAILESALVYLRSHS